MKPGAFFLLLATSLFALDEPAMLQAIAIKEGATESTIGRAHERGIYQMVPKTVQDAGGHDIMAAWRHLDWLSAQLKRKGVPVTPFHIGLAWNAGFTRATTGRAKVASYEYAICVENLYNDITGRLQPSSSPVAPLRLVVPSRAPLRFVVP